MIDSADHLCYSPVFVGSIYAGDLMHAKKNLALKQNVQLTYPTRITLLHLVEDDLVYGENAMVYSKAFLQAMVAAELHIDAEVDTVTGCATLRSLSRAGRNLSRHGFDTIKICREQRRVIQVKLNDQRSRSDSI